MKSYIQRIKEKSYAKTDADFVDFLIILQISPILARMFACLYLTKEEFDLLSHIVPAYRRGLDAS